MNYSESSCNKGFILLTTLIIIAILTLLVLTSMQHILLYYKAINRRELAYQNFYRLEELAIQSIRIQHSTFDNSCIFSMNSANEIMQILQEHKGCSVENGLYRYLIEDLGEFPCLLMEHKGKKYATHHYRISIVQILEELTEAFLQIRFVSVGSTQHCLTKKHLIRGGVSSWRYIPSVTKLHSIKEPNIFLN